MTNVDNPNNFTDEIVEISQYEGDKASVDIQVSTARRFPRNVRKSIDNAIAIVTMDKETASTCNYAVPRGGKAITGPSIHLAKILAQTWGNIRCEARVVEIDNKRVTSEAVCWDLENNVAIKATVKRSVLTKTGRMSEDMITVTGNAANSISLRNAILSVIPKAVIDKVYRAALQTVTGDLSDETKLTAKRTKVVNGLKEAYEVSEEEVLAAVGKASLSHLGASELAVLIGIGQAIKDGDTTVEEAFKGQKSFAGKNSNEDKLTKLQELFMLKEELLPNEEKVNIERIIKTNEVASYNKAITYLNGLKNE